MSAIVQVWNPRGWWVKIDRERGLILGHRRQRWPGVDVADAPKPVHAVTGEGSGREGEP